jgi:deazaflavin-dependent oxidoreductase (nitroreductase family)
MRPLVRLGLGPGNTWLLSVKGRRSGKTYETPVNLVRLGGETYLVSPYGTQGWARNARTAGEAGLRRGKRRLHHRLVELGPAEAAPVLRAYMRANFVTRPFFDVTPDSDDAQIAAEAPRHPVFRLT